MRHLCLTLPLVLSLTILNILPTHLHSYSSPSIRVSKVVWSFGKVTQGITISEEVYIKNEGEGNLHVKTRSTCDCLEVIPSKMVLAGGEISCLHLKLHTREYTGKVKHYIYVESNDPLHPVITIPVKGVVLGAEQAKLDETRLPSPDRIVVRLLVFGTRPCPTCRRIEEELIPRIERNLNVEVEQRFLSLSEPSNYEKLVAFERMFGARGEKLPAVVIEGEILEGREEIYHRLQDVIKRRKDLGGGDWPLVQADKEETRVWLEESFKRVAFIPVILAGLVDGVNPCAFTTIIFFLSYLVFVGRGRQEILLTGLLFSLGVFSCYFLLGLGILRFIQTLSGSSVVSKSITLIGVLATFCLFALSLYDSYLIKKGRVEEIKLKLPTSIRRQIHKTIGMGLKLWGYVFGSFLLGFTISLFEFVCTGQIYLPAIVCMVKMSPHKTSALSYLLLYNVMFVLPLLAIFSLFYLGVTREGFSRFLTSNLFLVKVLTSMVFLLFSGFLILRLL